MIIAPKNDSRKTVKWWFLTLVHHKITWRAIETHQLPCPISDQLTEEFGGLGVGGGEAMSGHHMV